MLEDKVLITGCGGMLGEAVNSVFSSKYTNVLATDIDLNEPWLKYMDVRDIDESEKVFSDFKPSIVVHLAALTDLEYCETNPIESWKTNALGTENIALLSKKYDATMIYVSTAGIFGGEQDEFTDFDKPNPLSHYGKSKFYGEEYVSNHLDKHFIFRAGWMMGGGLKKDKKFIMKIYNQIKAGAKTLNIVDDKFGTPTYTWNFAESMQKVLQTKYYGLYNQVCGGSCNRYDVAEEFVRLLDVDINLVKVRSDFFSKDYFAPRPYSEKLVNLKLNQRNINFMRDWKDCLAEYSTVFKNDLYK